ncbi:4-hydroxy-3-methylbut-2-enyl diphosphate reductase [Helicobacter fennelliae]|uniref:4-hydroxy-3-methylbut-2-enyl diphosphate reductase n=2 Tax=Helicobacter fennelliae TaxID=215 RepID=T1DW09_9HELI|nr:4-hydroxy-3-methylbut-2-enyl diphosphate reductase [Helicobacter fennelliae]GAD19213.1 4-hydroxy-3-methylbut-2-enyl diphosphate reductase [Helicobacter fennelliae MRY12-0050]SQB99000.1 4-hydroxy-3-methylbut-2-enyl diphosphate reductase [Helicobacter fennelliae]STP08281.1 4-hydroxy-3-methylbut-2-enyl diphosphate reductase [Helicobacter fennelliae]STQ84694.1 4-hydroxy-3-methylbut-2-enyl diphosphate reductase [Helicobacter fennelliae]
MEVRLAKKHGFCFGVKRAIKIAEKNKNSFTLGPLIHNYQEINRLQQNFNVGLEEDYTQIKEGSTLIIRTHGIPKGDLEKIKAKQFHVVDATCPFVTKPQQIVEKISQEGYQIIIFGDITHPEIKGVMSYAKNQDNTIVISDLQALKQQKIYQKVALISQTTKQIEKFNEIASYLITKCHEVRIFNTICNATFDNQQSARELSLEVDVMVIVGGKTSSNTKQLFMIAKENCKDSYLVEDEKEIQKEWFYGKKICGITAGASTPDWIVQKVKEHIENI